MFLVQNIAVSRFLPESFRWFYGHDRIEEAEDVVRTVSKVNRRPEPDMLFMKELAAIGAEGMRKDRKYSVLDLFKTKYLIKITVLLSLNW